MKSCRPSFVAAFVTVALALSVLALPLAAQNGSERPELDPTDLNHWKTVRSGQLTPDGRWYAYQATPTEGDAEVVVRPTDGGEEHRFPIGEPSGGGGALSFSTAGPLQLSADGNWLAFSTFPTKEEADEAKKADETLHNAVTIVNLTTWQEAKYEGVSRFEFAGDNPRWLVMRRVAPEKAPKDTGSGLLLLDLRTGVSSPIGGVSAYDLNDSGELLAYSTQSPDRVVNGVTVLNLRTNAAQRIDSERALYSDLSWADEDGERPALSVMRGHISEEDDTTYVAVGFTGFGGSVTTTVVDGTELAGFPEAMRITPERSPRWSDDRSALFFGIAEHDEDPDEGDRPDVKPAAGTPGAMQSPAPDLDEDDLPSLVLWHGNDPRLQSRQQVQERADERFNFLAAYHVAEGQFVQLATEAMRTVTLAANQRYAVGYDDLSYQLRDGIDGGRRQDVYAVDVKTGTAQKILPAFTWRVSLSPDGGKALYYDDGHYHVYDFENNSHTNISASVPVSFINVADDHNVEDPPIGPVGWASDSESVLLTDAWDIWRVDADGGNYSNLTKTGREEGIRYRRPLRYDPEQDGIDLSEPLYVEMYGEWTKKTGLAKLTSNGRNIETLLWDDVRHSVRRAENAETFVYTRETFTEFPDVWAAKDSFDEPVRLTDANPQQADYAWSAGTRLLNFVTDKGDSLQAALYLPAGYTEGEKYPTVVYIYEKLSQNINRYVVPNETRALNVSVYTSRGYAVLTPDIVYKINDPGMSAVWSVVPAVQAAIATGIVDADRVGLHGHSWGGYQTAHLITQTDIFASAIAGAALTDMVSMYNSVYWNSGTSNAGIFESSQGRFRGSYLDNHEAYLRNSPAFHVKNVTTPLVLLHNEKDGAVDFNQGITFYNSLREQEKDVVLLQYVGENHGLRNPVNQRDYTVRMMEFFDYYLRDFPAPDWWVNGVPRLEMEEHLKTRQKKPQIIS